VSASAEGGLTPGTQIGPFQVVKVIGRGGMGVVVEVRHVRAGQRAALKLLMPELRSAVDSAGVRRFLREAAILARLEHPGLVRILDHGESEHGPWIAMEYVAGEPLRARLAEGAGLAPAAALPILRRIASTTTASSTAISSPRTSW
jgi:serine/threonine protein kinase